MTKKLEKGSKTPEKKVEEKKQTESSNENVEEEISEDIAMTAEEIFRKKYPKEIYMTVHKVRENSNQKGSRKSGEKLKGVYEPGDPFDPKSPNLEKLLSGGVNAQVKKVR